MLSDSESGNSTIPSDSDNESTSDASPWRSESTSTRLRIARLPLTKKRCEKLMLPEHLAGYMEGRELDRDTEPIQCSTDIIEKVFNNYLIVKNILSYLRWQEKLICKDVSPLWNSAVNRLQLEQLEPVDFSLDASSHAKRKLNKLPLLKSSEFCTEPMVVFTFCGVKGYQEGALACTGFTNSPCSRPCDRNHHILDMIHQQTTAPKHCMYIMKAGSMSYLPLPHSPTIENAIKKPIEPYEPTFYGIYIPKITGMKFKMFNIKYSKGIQQDAMPELKKLTEKYTVKGVVGCLTDKYLLYDEDDDGSCLDFLNTIQPETPFAFGGCLIEDTCTKSRHLVGIIDSVNKDIDFVSGNMLTLGMFLTPKEDSSTSIQDPRHNFEVYSLVLESTDWSKLKIAKAIQEFSEKVPRFEHTAAIKFSCTGRRHKHEVEEHCFRVKFPHTRLVGCFGNGEMGVSHPPRGPPPAHSTKRPRECRVYDKVHSYSTVFFVMGWGKIIEEADRS